MIRMTHGSTRINDTTYSASSGPFSADEATEKRLVNLGVAVEVAPSPVATPPAPPSNGGAGDNKANGGNGAEEPESGEGHLDPEQLRTMTNAQLKTLAEDMGLDTSTMRVKEDFVTAISAVPVEVPADAEAGDGDGEEDGDDEEAELEDGETPPEVGAEEPVVE